MEIGGGGGGVTEGMIGGASDGPVDVDGPVGFALGRPVLMGIAWRSVRSVGAATEGVREIGEEDGEGVVRADGVAGGIVGASGVNGATSNSGSPEPGSSPGASGAVCGEAGSDGEAAGDADVVKGW